MSSLNDFTKLSMVCAAIVKNFTALLWKCRGKKKKKRLYILQQLWLLDTTVKLDNLQNYWNTQLLQKTTENNRYALSDMSDPLIFETITSEESGKLVNDTFIYKTKAFIFIS